MAVKKYDLLKDQMWNIEDKIDRLKDEVSRNYLRILKIERCLKSNKGK